MNIVIELRTVPSTLFMLILSASIGLLPAFAQSSVRSVEKENVHQIFGTSWSVINDDGTQRFLLVNVEEGITESFGSDGPIGTKIFVEETINDADGNNLTFRLAEVFTQTDVLKVGNKLKNAVLGPIEVRLCELAEDFSCIRPKDVIMKVNWEAGGKLLESTSDQSIEFIANPVGTVKDLANYAFRTAIATAEIDGEPLGVKSSEATIERRDIQVTRIGAGVQNFFFPPQPSTTNGESGRAVKEATTGLIDAFWSEIDQNSGTITFWGLSVIEGDGCNDLVCGFVQGTLVEINGIVVDEQSGDNLLTHFARLETESLEIFEFDEELGMGTLNPIEIEACSAPSFAECFDEDGNFQGSDTWTIQAQMTGISGSFFFRENKLKVVTNCVGEEFPFSCVAGEYDKRVSQGMTFVANATGTATLNSASSDAGGTLRFRSQEVTDY